MSTKYLSLLLQPKQLRSILQWKLWHTPVHKRDISQEDDNLRICFDYLNKTSRSFAAVIQELHPKLLVPVCLFYLVLRGLDTIEDDPTIPVDTKERMLREFHQHLDEPGWTFDGNGPNEKDRDLLVHFDHIIAELAKIPPPFQEIIRDITIKMENGMADYVVANERNPNGIKTIQDYEKYCHFAAGVVGEGLTRLFVKAELADPRLLDRPNLYEAMGQLLQQTNVIRDIREDWDDNRRWWPHDVWGKYVDNWDDMFDPANQEKAMQCCSELVLNALGKINDCLFYMAGVKDQSVFNFVAIPQSMAIATLELVFRNPAMFQRNVKITKGDACQLMWESTQNLYVVCETFRRYVRRIHQRNDPRDPNFMAISIQCSKIEQFIEALYPRQDPKQLTIDNARRKNKMPTADPGEGVVLIGVVLVSLVCISLLMIGTAMFFGKRLDFLWKTDSIYWPGYEPVERSWTNTVSTITATTTAAVHKEL